MYMYITVLSKRKRGQSAEEGKDADFWSPARSFSGPAPLCLVHTAVYPVTINFL